MAIDIQNWDTDSLTYAVVPETVDIVKANELIDEVKFQREVNGWTKERTIRKAGEVPFEIMWNYYLMHCDNRKEITLEQFYNRDNCVMQKRLLNEFPAFRVSTERMEIKSNYKGIIQP